MDLQMSYRHNMKGLVMCLWWINNNYGGDRYFDGNMLTHGPNAHTTYQVSVSLMSATKLHTNVHNKLYTYVHTNAHTNAHTIAHTNAHTNVHTKVHTNVHIYQCTH